MLNTIFNFLCLMFCSLMVTSLFIKYTKIAFGWGAIVLLIFGIFLYFINVLLIRHFIKKGAPGVMELDELYGKPMKDGEYLWEKTAGTGIVPKWVSWIGIWALSSFAGIIVWLVTWIIKNEGKVF